MYCPNCGARNRKKQNFCRYCGLHLQEIEKTFASQLVFGDDTKQLKRLRSVRRATETAVFLAGVIFCAGIVTQRYFDPQFGKVLMTAGLLAFFLAQLIRWVHGYLQRQNPRQNVGVPGAHGSTAADAVTEGNRHRLIEDRPFEPAASAAEHTTSQLTTAEKTK